MEGSPGTSRRRLDFHQAQTGDYEAIQDQESGEYLSSWEQVYEPEARIEQQSSSSAHGWQSFANDADQPWATSAPEQVSNFPHVLGTYTAL